MKRSGELNYANFSSTGRSSRDESTVTRKYAHNNRKKPIHILYFTDPFSPAGYAMGKQLKRLKERFEKLINIECHMGGLMPLWELYRNNGISTHADMTKHWKNAGNMYNLPISGSVWHSDPPHSSFPASIAFKAAQIQDEQKATAFLQRMGEMLFVENKNISKWIYLQEAAEDCALDIVRLKKDQTGQGRRLFEEDLVLAHKLDVMGFPTLFLQDSNYRPQVILEGYQRPDKLEQSLLQLMKGEMVVNAKML